MCIYARDIKTDKMRLWFPYGVPLFILMADEFMAYHAVEAPQLPLLSSAADV